MTQLSPSNLIYSQALEIINDLRKDYAALKYKTPAEVIEVINDALTNFEKSAGKTLAKYEPVSKSEVPNSDKMNRFWSTLQADINILQEQVDLLRAAGIFTHNFIKTEINRSKNDNKRLLSKLKTLELYSDTNDDSLVFFGDTFISDDFIDNSLITPSDRAAILGYGYIGLGPQEIETTIDNTTTIKILTGSNGFAGNNQEIIDPINAPLDPITGDKQYTFQAELYDSSVLKNVIDNQPNSWFEFEKYYINPTIRNTVFNYNFQYSTNILDSTSYINDPSSFAVDSNGLINWANGFNELSTGVLKLKIQIDLGSIKNVNIVKFTPYGLIDNRNNPIKVVKVLYSADGSIWDTASPENVWIANSIDRRLSTINTETISIGDATWILKTTEAVRYFRFEIEQLNPIQSKVGHLFYLDEDFDGNIGSITNLTLSLSTTAEEVVYDDDLYYDNPLYDIYLDAGEGGNSPNYGANETTDTNAGNTELTEAQILGYRRPGPIPPVTKPTLYYDNSRLNNKDLIQKREFFEGLRWAIGIRDIELNSIAYSDTSFFISNKLQISGIVDRVALEADVVIPESFDSSVNWIKFYISPDDGITWYPISRIQDDFLGIPEMIAFNDPTPIDLREPGVEYIETGQTVDSLRIKVEFTRPSDNQYLTPILRSYKLKVKKRV